MLIALCTSAGILRLVHRSEAEVSNLLVRRPELNFFFLSTDFQMHDLSQPTLLRAHLLVDCWCGGA